LLTFDETKDPNEIKDYTYDWSEQIGEGETIASQIVSLVASGGAAIEADSVASPISRVFFSGGTDGQMIVFTIRAQTSGNRTLEEGFAINIVDSVRMPTDAENLRADLAVVDASMRKLMAGEFVKEVSRDGRRIVRENPSFAQLTAHREWLVAAIGAAEAAETGLRRRRAITLAYRN